MTEIAGLLGIAAVVLSPLLVGLVLTIKKLRKNKCSVQRGFEVKLTPSMTPGLFEKKEKYHG